MKSTTRREHLKTVAGTSLLSFAGLSTAPLVAAEKSSVSRLAMEFMGEFEVPGLSIAIAKDGDIICRKAFGVANIKAGKRLTVDHRFRIASVSKPITATAIFLLIEQGKLHLNDPVFGKGALLGVTNPSARPGAITVHHLLTHTSGGWGNKKNDPMFHDPGMNYRELISWAIRTLPQENDPGEKYAYSNFGYCLLGRIIEKVSGESYETFVRENVFRPCEIDKMELGRTKQRDRLKGEVSYYADGKPVTFEMNIRRMDAHGGWVGTPEDMVNFALRVDGFPKPADFLKQESIASMTERSGVNPNYACGWSVNKAGNRWHNGSLPGLSSLLVRTSNGYCWAACANTRKDKMGLALDKLMWKMIEVL